MVFGSVNEIRTAALKILREGTDASTVAIRLKGLAGSIAGNPNSYPRKPPTPFEAVEVRTRFEEERRVASFVITQGYRDPSPTQIHLSCPTPS